MSIFLSVASYCDPVLGFTLARAIAQARHPESLHFGVVEQSPADWIVPAVSQVAPARMSYVRIDPLHARGPCWARALAMSFYAGEDWFFQIDSHMEFGEDWDVLMIDQARRLQPGRLGAVVSSYPDPFTFEGMQAVHTPRPGVLAHVVKPGTGFAPDHLVLGFEAHPVTGPEPVSGFHIGAGCLFAPGSYAQHFPYDPNFYFHGEEQAVALRLFTHGWDIFHMAAMPIWHLYNIPQEGTLRRALHWDEAHDAQRGEKWWTLEEISRTRLGDLAAGRIRGVYGLGSVRSVADYAQFSGIDYTARTIAPRAYSAPAPAPVPVPASAPG